MLTGVIETQEVSELLGSKISTEDEAEVEDELAALEAEVAGKEQQLPSVPNTNLPKLREQTKVEAPVEEERQAVPA